VLIALVFASLFLGQRLPSARVLWQRAASQTCFGLVLGFGQYLVGGVLVLLVLQPLLGVNPLMACLIEVGFEGGHGTAAGMGPTFDDLGLPAGEALGLAMAPVGVLAAVLVGSTLVVIGRSLAWLQGDDTPAPPEPPEPSHTPAAVQGTTTIDQLTVNLALTGAAVVSARLQGSIGSLAMDLLITAAMASLNLPLLEENWLAFALLALVGLLWNLAVVLLLAPRMFRDHWFERAIADFGQGTGVTATGLLLLRMADPRGRSRVLEAFSFKQLLFEPFLGGGLITALAPIALATWGLPHWTAMALALTLMSALLGLGMAHRSSP